MQNFEFTGVVLFILSHQVHVDSKIHINDKAVILLLIY